MIGNKPRRRRPLNNPTILTDQRLVEISETQWFYNFVFDDRIFCLALNEPWELIDPEMKHKIRCGMADMALCWELNHNSSDPEMGPYDLASLGIE